MISKIRAAFCGNNLIPPLNDMVERYDQGGVFLGTTTYSLYFEQHYFLPSDYQLPLHMVYFDIGTIISQTGTMSDKSSTTPKDPAGPSVTATSAALSTL